MSGFFITLEGIDGCGKTTQAKLLARYLQGRGRRVVHTREPGGTPAGEAFRALFLHRPDLDLVPEAEILLMGADRAEHVAKVIRPELAAGNDVVCERYTDSTVAYQGYGPEGSTGRREQIEAVNRIATGGLEPDLTFLLDIAPETAAGRLGAGRDRIEAKGAAFQWRVRAGYLRLAAQMAHRVVVVAADAPPQAIHQAITGHLTSRLAL